MLSPVDHSQISACEAHLGCSLPESLRDRLLANNGGYIAVERALFKLFPIWDDSDPKHAGQTRNHIVRENAIAQVEWGLAPELVAIAGDGCGGYLVFRKGEDQILYWDEETRGVEPVDVEWEVNLLPQTILKRFETPDTVREFPLGKFETVTLGPMTIGRATYEPGWKWSEHVGKDAGAEFCTVEHVGMVVSGTATAAMKQNDGSLDVVEMKAGDFFYIPSEPHDSWVVGDEPYVSLHFLGAEKYAGESK